MTLRTFYRVALLFPLLGMVIAVVLRRLAEADRAGPERLLLPGSLARGLMAYLAVAAWMWVELGRRPESALRPLVWRAPLLYVAAGGLLVILLAALRGWLGALWPERAPVMLLRIVVHLVVAYGYVALVHVALSGLQAAGVLARPTTAEPS